MSETTAVRIPVEDVTLDGELTIPSDPAGIVVFAHGSGSSRHSPRNIFVAEQMHENGLATLLFDLLTLGEERRDMQDRQLRFDTELLTTRLLAAVDWVLRQEEFEGWPVGVFGASTGAAAALKAAARRPEAIGAVVSRGGRPDLASEALPAVKAPVLLVVGERDTPVIPLNQQAFAALACEKHLEIIPGATHLFEEPGGLETVARHAARWFLTHLGSG